MMMMMMIPRVSVIKTLDPYFGGPQSLGYGYGFPVGSMHLILL